MLTAPHRRNKRWLWLAWPGLLLGALGWLGCWYIRVEGHLTAAEAAARRHDDEEARQHLEAYLATWPNSARARLLAARTARRLHRYEEAEEHLRIYRQAGGDAASITLERMLAALQRGEAEMEPVLRARAEGGDEQALTILEVLIQFYLDTYRLHQALECLNQYLAQRPNDLHALLGRAFVWERFFYLADALQDYRRAVQHHPDSDAARLRLGRALLTAGTPQEALVQFQHLQDRHPDRLAVGLGLAQSRRQLGQNDEARRLLDALLGEREEADLLTERGQLALDEGELDRAETWLRRAVRLAPHDRQANYALYRCLLRQGRKEADEWRTRVARIDANLRRLDQLTRAVLKAPNDASLRCQVGLLFLENGEEREGVRWLTQALRLDPHCEAARRALADYARQGQRSGVRSQESGVRGQERDR